MAPPVSSGGTKMVAGAAIGAAVAHTVYPYWLRDVRVIRLQNAFREKVVKMIQSRKFVLDMFLEVVHSNPYKLCVIYDSRLYTYRDIDKLSNKFANLLIGRGMKCGDRVALFMYNEPAFIWTYLGCAKLGVSCGFINFNLRAESLIHCLEISKAKVVIVGQDIQLLEALKEHRDKLRELGIRVLSVSNADSSKYDFVEDIDQEVALSSDEAIPSEMRRNIQPNDVTVLIYTSGTTGLPKAGIITYERQLRSTSTAYPYMRSDDRVYLFLPLYHGNAFLIGLGNSLRVGATMVLARKFSVTRFWEDCCRYDVTYFIYIGEICRYLLSRPEGPLDKKHRIRMITGNGLRPDIWQDFKRRFNIPVIHEFYGSTEGLVFIGNIDNTVGAVGKLSPLLKRRMAFEMVQYDYDTAQPLRDSNGRCIPVKLGSPGLMLCTINQWAKFEGYLGPSNLTEAKIVRNAFQDGDLYYNSGDLMMLDKNYYLYFVDRVGDTFRWKGENVATTEVAQVVASFEDIQEANVYGVAIPGQDGRVGMAAVVLKNEDTLDKEKLFIHVTSHLPSYACPMFLRVRPSLSTTGTFKYTKVELVKEGFDPNIIKEPLYYLDNEKQTYSELKEDSYKTIVIGKAKM
ncbi:long-chain fatty acid transport protein 2-like [Ptychodera flava]|uniref:long-chain fatty acid transport protein 2-like n=1 Tax=Ptychodera flava TaxID=63121 RepID=UPI003969D3C2